jgi:hypothetical protein
MAIWLFFPRFGILYEEKSGTTVSLCFRSLFNATNSPKIGTPLEFGLAFYSA